MSNDESRERTPLIGWFVIDIDVDADRDTPIHSFISGPFPSQKRAEKEAERKRDAFDDAMEEWDGDNPYDHKAFQVQEVKLRDFQLDKLEREDRESYQIRKEAADAVAAGMLGFGTGGGGDAE